MPRKSLAEILPTLKSAQIIEGNEACIEYLTERAKKMLEKGETASLRRDAVADVASLMSSGRIVTAVKNGVPKYTNRFSLGMAEATGSIDKAAGVTLEQAKAMAAAAGVPWSDEYEKPSLRAFGWWGSDERVDRAGDIVRQNWVFDDFDMNPQLLACHNWGAIESILGNVISHTVERRSTTDYSGPALRCVCLFATAAMNPLADVAFRLAQANFLRASSVGFFPMRIIFVQDTAEREQIGLGPFGVVYDQSSLGELTLCPMPMNPGAVQNAIKRVMNEKLLRKGDTEHIVDLLRRSQLMDEAERNAAAEAAAEVCKEIFPEPVVSVPPPAPKPTEPKAAPSNAPAAGDVASFAAMMQLSATNADLANSPIARAGMAWAMSLKTSIGIETRTVADDPFFAGVVATAFRAGWLARDSAKSAAGGMNPPQATPSADMGKFAEAFDAAIATMTAALQGHSKAIAALFENQQRAAEPDPLEGATEPPTPPPGDDDPLAGLDTDDEPVQDNGSNGPPANGKAGGSDDPAKASTGNTSGHWSDVLDADE